MKKIFKGFAALILILSLSAISFTGCAKSGENPDSSSADAQSESANSENVTVVKVVTNNNYYPLTYLDDTGVLAGYAIDVAKLVDEALPQYKFDIEPSSGDAILLGLERGTYDQAIGGFYWNPEREEKFIYPEFDGGGIIGVVVRNEDADVKNLSDIAEKGLRVAPTMAGGGIIGPLNDYNEENKDKPIKFDTIDSRTAADIWQGVLDGRYDADVENKHTWNQVVSADAGKKFKDGLTFNSFTVVKSYDLFNKNQQELADAYSEVIRSLKADGTLSKLSEKWFGEDLFKLTSNGDK